MTIPFEEIRVKWMADPAFRAEYDRLAPEFEALLQHITKEKKKDRKKVAHKAADEE